MPTQLSVQAGNLGKEKPGPSVTPPGTGKNVISVGSTLNSPQSWFRLHCVAGGHFEEQDTCNAYQTWGEDIPDALVRYANVPLRTLVTPSSLNHVLLFQSLFSSYGPTHDYRIKPDVVVVGEKILSADKGTCSGDDSDLDPGQGTSTATPVLAGHLTLVRQYFLEGYYPSGRLIERAT